MEEKQTIYYNSFKDDIVKNKKQDKKITNKFKWIHTNLIYILCSKITYIIAYIFGYIYTRFFLHVTIENKDKLKKYKKTGYFIYGNHTLTIGDVFNPVRVASPKRIYVVASQSNLGVPVIGKILPMLGALIIPENISQMKEFFKAIKLRIKQKKAVIIYPEAHLWPYYTKIRPFDETAFKFPVELDVPAFCMTTTYYKRKNKKKPGIKIYIDGPFFPEKHAKAKTSKTKLCKEIYETMKKRSENSTYEYYTYKEKEN